MHRAPFYDDDQEFMIQDRPIYLMEHLRLGMVVIANCDRILKQGFKKNEQFFAIISGLGTGKTQNAAPLEY